MLRIAPLITTALLLLTLQIASATPVIDTAEIIEDIEEVTEEYEESEIPEPMVFDLVRPLGAKKGELEINTLIKLDDGDFDHIHISPEIEYVVRDGVAVELEMPMRGSEIESIKFAAQTTIGTAFQHHYIHGLQNLYRYDINDNRHLLDNIYIGGYRFNKSFSNTTMQGLRLDWEGDRLLVKGLLNNSFFYQRKKLKLGLETNYIYGGTRHDNHFLLMPQLHIPLNKQCTLQIGSGFEKFGDSDTAATSAARLVFEI